MTVSTSTNKVSYACNGSVVEFNIPYKFFITGEVYAILEDDTTLAQTDLVEGVDYNISTDNPDFDEGATLTTVPTYAAGNTIIIYRELPYVQETDYQEGDAFPAEAHEDALDYLTMLIQQMIESGIFLDAATPLVQGNILFYDGTSWQVLAPGVSGQFLATAAATDPFWSVPTASGGGDVLGPVSGTDNAIALFDGVSGKLIKVAAITIDDGKIVIPNKTDEGILNIVAMDTEPTAPIERDIYLDDGTNTDSGNMSFRRWTGSAWEDIAKADSSTTISTDTTIYVADTGDDVTGDGTSGDPYYSIEKAMEHLNDYIIVGDTIVTVDVADGTYTALSSVDITHAQAHKIEIVGNTTTPSNVDLTFTASEYGFKIDGSTRLKLLSGLKITTSGADGIQVNAGSFASLFHIELQGNDTGYGVYVHFGSNCNVSYIRADDYNIGMAALSHSGLNIANDTTVDSCPSIGIYGEVGSEVTIDNAPTITNCSTGITMAYNSNAYLISEANFSGNVANSSPAATVGGPAPGYGNTGSYIIKQV